MSEDPIYDEVATQGGGKTKWLIGAAAAAVVLGGGYFAWQNFTPGWENQDETQTAYNEPYDPAPVRAGPLEPAQGAFEDNAALDEGADLETQPRAAAPARRTPARAPAIPEETIGVTPEQVATSSDEIVVTAARRPIWVRTPSARRLSTLYPERALERGREGEARLHCTVLDGGALDCVRAEETPGGFGNAALRVARGFRHSTTLADGSDAVGSPVNLRVVFRIEDDRRG